MGWGSGEDRKGRPIGYNEPARCDHAGCLAEIDRGLSYACGGMHGDETAYGEPICCEDYFCEKHLFLRVTPNLKLAQFCPACTVKLDTETDQDDLNDKLDELYAREQEERKAK